MEPITLKTLQTYIKDKDNDADILGYFHKLIEEIGELSEAIRKGTRLEDDKNIKGTIEEELYDVIYYVLTIANQYDIDIEECVRLKEKVNSERYGHKPLES